MKTQPGNPSSQSPSGWMSPPLMAVLAAVFIFVAAAAWSPGPATAQDEPTPTATLAATLAADVTADAALPTPTPEPAVVTIAEATPIPQEWEENKEQTYGVVLGGVMLVIIIIGGTLGVITPRKR